MRSTPIELQKFYQSAVWKRTRKAFIQSKRGICEECEKSGWEVHHKIPLTLLNYKDSNISLSFDNLELLCTSCHNARRTENVYIRSDLMFDDNGYIVPKPIAPRGSL